MKEKENKNPDAFSPKAKETLPSRGLLARVKAINFWHISAVFSIIYILNPTAGIFELIPDILPLIGNLDETFFNGLLFISLFELGILDNEKLKKISEIKTLPYTILNKFKDKKED